MSSRKLYLKIKLNYLSNKCDENFENEAERTFNHGFKTCKFPPRHKDLMGFEYDFQKRISNIQFRRVNNDFQKRLKSDIK